MANKEYNPWTVVSTKNIPGPGRTSTIKVVLTKRAVQNGYFRYNITLENHFTINNQFTGGKEHSSNPNVPCGISLDKTTGEVVVDEEYQDNLMCAIEDILDEARNDAEKEYGKKEKKVG